MLYVYICTECNYQFEEFSNIAAGKKRLKEPCPKCGGKLKRPIGNLAVHMRGYKPEDARYLRGMRR